MCLSIDSWMQLYISAMRKFFDNRIWFIGLQGSYGRGEATQHSDIDVVLILDTVSGEDLKDYSEVLDTLPERDKICGFVAGKEELWNWPPFDFFQLYYDTVPYVGSLDSLFSRIQNNDVCQAIWTGTSNTYHLCVHNLVHGRNDVSLKKLYKSSFYTLQAISFLETGQYNRQKKDLFSFLQKEDALILSAGMEIQEKEALTWEQFYRYSTVLIQWASNWIKKIGNCFLEENSKILFAKESKIN